MNIKLDLYYIYNIIMENGIIIICITLLFALFLLLITEDKIYKSHRISPVSGETTKITACIHDPYFNSGFIVSLASAEELKEIQVSLKKADKIYIIHQEYGEYTLINNKHKREQIIKKCSYNLIEKIMKENKTNMVDYSV
tara:strand:+ start:2952 stop:3371 length:420 start_codon:yes stop_codon:yes gene_type:complete